MGKRKFQGSLVLLSAVLLVTGAADMTLLGETPLGESPATLQLPSPVTRWQQWHGFSGSERLELRTLILNDWLPDREMTRVLVESSVPFRLILSEERFILDGVSRFRLVEARSGWWLEFTEYSGLALDSVAQAADPAQVAHEFSRLLDQDYEGRLALRSQGARVFETPFRLWQEDAYLQFAAHFAEEGRGRKLVEKMAPSSRESVRLLASLARGGHAGVNLGRFQNLLTFLVAILDHEEPGQAAPRPRVDWRLLDEGYRNSLELESQQVVFANAFQGISAEDPLTDLRATKPPVH